MKRDKKIAQYSESFNDIPTALTPRVLKFDFLAKLNFKVSSDNPMLLKAIVLPCVRKHGGIVRRGKINQLVSNTVMLGTFFQRNVPLHLCNIT